MNSRVGKANARGEWVASWGSLGKGPGEFDTPHGMAVSPKDEIYVADRGNRRIQVFDPEGKYIREFIIDVPVDLTRGKVTYGTPTPNAKTGSQAPGAPDALCMTPGPNPVLFVGDLYPSRIYKVSLEGKVLGVYGQPGRNLGEFGWIHAIACPSENEILGRRADQLARAEAGDEARRHALGHAATRAALHRGAPPDTHRSPIATRWFRVRKRNVFSEMAGVAIATSPRAFVASNSYFGPAFTT